MVTITNTTGGRKGFGTVRFPVGASTHSEETVRAVAKHPHFRAAVERGDLVVEMPEGASPTPEPGELQPGSHVPQRELSDDELLEQLEREENDRLAAEAAKRNQ